ncbi:hypothetical protein B0H17DRAFT_1192337 [Mycena rosella]|uniref:Uncharacterized protein n=1 Tax=Mycena rosella TaxID=1033263 RepID=A0AAD7GWK0_MYCRO|nr:hypothetical protein B0H17DRAFT_1192337 [Mycena rosella]
MAPKLKLRLAAPSPPRNSFTASDYYRTTREEIYSPIPRAESLSPDSPYAELPKTSPTRRLAHIREDSSDKGERGGGRAGKRAVVFRHLVHALLRKWRRQKDRAAKSKAAQR